MRVLKVAARHDDRNTPADVRHADVEQRAALGVGQQELLRIVGEDADAVDALVDHAVEHAALAFEVDVAGLGEGRRRDRKDSREGLGGGCGHGDRLFECAAAQLFRVSLKNAMVRDHASLAAASS